MSIAEALIEQVEHELDRAGGHGRVRALDLVIGRMSGVHAAALRFAFDVLTPGTPLEGVALRICETKASLACRRCDHRQPIDELPLQCPRCGSPDIGIEGGQDLLLQAIELDEAGPS